jgi:hypothetical protein
MSSDVDPREAAFHDFIREHIVSNWDINCCLFLFIGMSTTVHDSLCRIICNHSSVKTTIWSWRFVFGWRRRLFCLSHIVSFLYSILIYCTIIAFGYVPVHWRYRWVLLHCYRFRCLAMKYCISIQIATTYNGWIRHSFKVCFENVLYYHFLLVGLWNYVFLLSNICLFILLPFSYFFIESQGFTGQRKVCADWSIISTLQGIMTRVYETVAVCVLVMIVVSCLAHVIAILIDETHQRNVALFSEYYSLFVAFWSIFVIQNCGHMSCHLSIRVCRCSACLHYSVRVFL